MALVHCLFASQSKEKQLSTHSFGSPIAPLPLTLLLIQILSKIFVLLLEVFMAAVPICLL
jgi:hypothetical protein